MSGLVGKKIKPIDNSEALYNYMIVPISFVMFILVHQIRYIDIVPVCLFLFLVLCSRIKFKLQLYLSISSLDLKLIIKPILSEE